MANTQISITANGTKTLATAGKYCDRNIDVNVNVPASGITPTGTKSITSNGTHDVTIYASANVNVPVPSGYIKPSGTKEITENGTYDIASFASALVNVSGGKVTTEAYEVAFDSDFGNSNGEEKTLLTGNAFIKANYASDNFAVLLLPTVASSVSAQHNVRFMYHGNRNLVSTSSYSHYGIVLRDNSATALGYDVMTAKISGSNYNACFRARSTGNLTVYCKGRYIKAGTYKIVLMCWEE